MNKPSAVFVRPPGESFVDALGQQPGAPAIDLARAQAQHRLYVAALREAGLRVTELPAEPDHPDACFVQDVAYLLPGLAVFGRPAEPSRQGEIALLKPHLPASLPAAQIEPPGTLEWGDVMRIGDTFYVGQSARSNAAGTEQLRRLLEPLGLAVEALPVVGGLHLLSGANYLGKAPNDPQSPGVLLAWEDYAGLPQFAGLDIIVVPAHEKPAANCLALPAPGHPQGGEGETVIMPAGFPETASALWHRGFRVLTVPIGEFAKADGGVTCLSLLSAA